MPVKIPDGLPAQKLLSDESVFIMTERRAQSQDIRPLHIAVLNLMPTKEVTETQLLRMIGNSPLQSEVTFLRTATHLSRHTSPEHLMTFYRTFEDVRRDNIKFDGLIITGAPVEHMRFEDVNYWDELKDIMEWAKSNVFSTLYICWAAQAGLYHHFGINKFPLTDKRFGIFEHRVLKRTKLTQGFDDTFWAPHSRHTEVRAEDIEGVKGLELISLSDEAGVFIAASEDGRHVFITGHLEYDSETLSLEYKRDLQKGLPINMPLNYYPNDNADLPPKVTWRAHGSLFFQNWLNYYLYQETPYRIEDIE